MASIDGNGGHGFQEPGHGMDPRANGDAGPASGTPLDPSHIGRLVEREVATMLEAAQVEADRISATAMGAVRKAEAKIAALQLELDAAVAELRELADRTERTTSAPAETSLAPEPPMGPRLAEPSSGAPEEPERAPEPTSEPSIPAVLTEPPAAMRRAVEPPPLELDIPPSDKVARLLRQHLS
jgi:hypothetical protein